MYKPEINKLNIKLIIYASLRTYEGPAHGFGWSKLPKCETWRILNNFGVHIVVHMEGVLQ